MRCHCALVKDLPEGEAMSQTYCLLHEFGKLGDFLERFPVDSPQAFYQALWGREP